jgi:acyl carrier protein
MQLNLEHIQSEIIDILKDMTQDWGLDMEGDFGPGTQVVADLEFSSVDIIHLIVAIEERFKRPKMGFEELLMKEGRYVDDLSVDQLAQFVASKLPGDS